MVLRRVRLNHTIAAPSNTLPEAFVDFLKDHREREGNEREGRIHMPTTFWLASPGVVVAALFASPELPIYSSILIQLFLQGWRRVQR